MASRSPITLPTTMHKVVKTYPCKVVEYLIENPSNQEPIVDISFTKYGMRKGMIVAWDVKIALKINRAIYAPAEETED